MVFSDFSNHVSLEDAVRLGRAKERKFLHGDLGHLEELLVVADGSGTENTGGKLILTDGVFSVDGDVCDLPGLMKLADAHGARVVVDSSHDLGVLGPTGAGAGEHFGLRPDLVTGALSKSLASVGGVIAGPADVIRYLRFHARAALFTAAASPANVAAALASLRILRAEPERRVRVLDLAERLHNGLRALGFDTGASVTPVVPVLVSGRERCLRVWRRLFDAGVFAAPMVHPVVRAGREVLRVTLTAAHTDDQLERVLAAFEHVGRVEGSSPAPRPLRTPRYGSPARAVPWPPRADHRARRRVPRTEGDTARRPRGRRRRTAGTGGSAGPQPIRTVFETVTWSMSVVRTVAFIVQMPATGRVTSSAAQ